MSSIVAVLPLLVGCAGQESAGSSSTTPASTSADNSFTFGSGSPLYRRQGKATGTVQAGACKLWIADKPDYIMTLNDQPMGGLRIRVTSEGGAKPMVRYPRGTFCAKEIEGTPPTVTRGAWSKDSYELYIGVPEQGQTIEYTLEVFEEPS